MSNPRPLKVNVRRVPGQDPGSLKISIELEYDPDDPESRQAAYDKFAEVLAAVIPPEDRRQFLEEFKAVAILAMATDPV